MKAPSFHPDEERRLEALYDCQLIDSDPDERFDRLTRLAREIFGTRIVLLSLVDSDRQWFKSRQGLDVCQTGRDESFCGHAILGQEIFCVFDTIKDERFSDNPLVVGAPNIRFYAGAPIRTSSGMPLGTLCLIDDKPRQMSDRELSILRQLATCIEQEIEDHQAIMQHEADRTFYQLSRLPTVDLRDTLSQGLMLACRFLKLNVGFVVSDHIHDTVRVTLDGDKETDSEAYYASLTGASSDMIAIARDSARNGERFIGMNLLHNQYQFGLLGMLATDPVVVQPFTRVQATFVRSFAHWATHLLRSAVV
jgi:hypothetical protein